MPFGEAVSQFGVRDIEMQAAVGYVQLDHVPSAHGGERPASRRLWRGVDDDGAERRAAHAGIADPYHVAETLLEQLLGQR